MYLLFRFMENILLCNCYFVLERIYYYVIVTSFYGEYIIMQLLFRLRGNILLCNCYFVLVQEEITITEK
jgi:hypothetical protein